MKETIWRKVAFLCDIIDIASIRNRERDDEDLWFRATFPEERNPSLILSILLLIVRYFILLPIKITLLILCITAFLMVAAFLVCFAFFIIIQFFVFLLGYKALKECSA
ncbi:hypothetical protein EHEL_100310 [Encephalitozoon hellem ATCC 50504]|uniref:Uncharacterized protein n=1 Tax=Encephalitozoon hellem TaxID=27973 RepID=A0A9Q9F8W1_ENCHE|nr:uncharacterized protein EHEL_100310 [Encephalitozoon hellem ATCC 50504]AFM99125.1 hypothetical protein EHEL_100310 [Encephalitozoon hellem ATCC 50504]UTX44109.1 hypothetical protein GPU96_10g18980 [Encephalitozoon hellem]|eukprot:XP_003888106.1 hypothetical protein EHEL_100310 [Encephalitozoon hellem ATCC 50504]